MRDHFPVYQSFSKGTTFVKRYQDPALRRNVSVLMLLATVILILTACSAPAAAPVEESLEDQTASAVQMSELPTNETVFPARDVIAEPVPSDEETPSETELPAESEVPDPDEAMILLEEMSLLEKLCQLLIIRPGDFANIYPVTAMSETLQASLQAYPVGGFYLDTSNMLDSDQLKRLTAALKTSLPIVPVIVCDEEGGTVSRLMQAIGTREVGAMYSYREEGTEKAFSNARILAEDLVLYGINGDLAPVADVWSNPANPVIRTRAYSNDYSQAAELVAAAVDGFHAGGVLCTLKHFPGHGDTAEDSHKGAAVVWKSLEQLREEELLPFRSGIAAGADMVMIGHLTVPELDTLPAPFSNTIVTGLLREELGFTGVVITDALEMQALGDYTSAEEAILAVQAGVDLLLCPADPEESLRALSEAVSSGVITQERIDESVLRILRMKLRITATEQYAP